MGLQDKLMYATGNSEIDGFSRAQVEQFLLAEKCGVPNTECKKHREWGSIFMNYCWNREKEGKSLDCIYKAADYLGRFPREKGCTICDQLDIVDYAVHTFEDGRNPIGPERATSENGIFDACMFKFLAARDRQLAKGAKTLWSGRVSMSDVGMMDDTVIMGEGIEKANEIAGQLQSWSANKRSTLKSDNPFDVMVERGWNMLNILLGLDDMNIRGYQLIYAMEYCDGSIEKLYEVLSGDRSQELCDYINMKSAQDFMAGNGMHNQIAVSDGASFCYPGTDAMMRVGDMKLTMNELTAPTFAQKECTKMQVDYSTLDIINQVDTESALRICAARGFQLLKIQNRNGKFGDANTWIGLYNPETKDYIVAPSATPKNICYGGVSLFVHRTIPASERHSTFGWRGSSGGHNDQDGMYYEWTYDDGLFRNWEQSKMFLPAVDYDWSKIGFDSYGIPIPKYFELPFMRDAEMWDILGNDACLVMREMGHYHFEKLVNGLLCLYDEELKNSVSPHYALYEDWFFNGGFADLASIWDAEEDQSWKVVYLVLAYLKVPDDIIERIADGITLYYKDRDERSNSNRTAWDKKENNSSKFAKMRKKGLNKTKLLDAVVNGYKLPDPAALPIKLPWLQ